MCGRSLGAGKVWERRGGHCWCRRCRPRGVGGHGGRTGRGGKGGAQAERPAALWAGLPVHPIVPVPRTCGSARILGFVFKFGISSHGKSQVGSANENYTRRFRTQFNSVRILRALSAQVKSFDPLRAAELGLGWQFARTCRDLFLAAVCQGRPAFPPSPQLQQERRAGPPA